MARRIGWRTLDDRRTPRMRGRSGVIRSRDCIASRRVLLMALAGRNRSELTMTA